jgi:hypothetical protein
MWWRLLILTHLVSKIYLLVAAGFWDFGEVRGEGNGWEPYGRVYDPLVRCVR